MVVVEGKEEATVMARSLETEMSCQDARTVLCAAERDASTSTICSFVMFSEFRRSDVWKYALCVANNSCPCDLPLYS
jgi:hypothetical protein